MTNPMAPGIPLAIAVVAALVLAALRAAARRPGSPGVPGTRPAPVTVTADQSRPRPAVTTGAHDRAVRQRSRPPRPAGPLSHRPVPAVAYDAKSIAPIGVQLVKDMLRLLNGTG